MHLKNKFGRGYLLTVRVGRADCADAVAAIERYMSHALPLCRLRQVQNHTLDYSIEADDSELADLFGALESAREQLGSDVLDEYSITQTSLDQVFVGIAGQQAQDLRDRRAHSSAMGVAESSVLGGTTAPAWKKAIRCNAATSSAASVSTRRVVDTSLRLTIGKRRRVMPQSVANPAVRSSVETLNTPLSSSLAANVRLSSYPSLTPNTTCMTPPSQQRRHRKLPLPTIVALPSGPLGVHRPIDAQVDSASSPPSATESSQRTSLSRFNSTASRSGVDRESFASTRLPSSLSSHTPFSASDQEDVSVGPPDVHSDTNARSGSDNSHAHISSEESFVNIV